ncbi:MAG: histidine phosphatase family protein [Clostridia bacterium]|nr:histidine phosphatase family protein [Clostridia bacterium]
MKIYFVRHGRPDYKTDTLTELGIKQAQAAAERLKDCNIQRVFASSKGRAMQTAQYTAEAFGLDVIPCDFIREIDWFSVDGEPIPCNGQPWMIAERHVSEGISLSDFDWAEDELFSKSRVVNSYKTVCDGLDSWLEELGYKREGEYYRVTGKDTWDSVAMFSHAGSSSAALSHMFNIPFPQLCAMVDIECTSVTVVELLNKTGELVSPKFRILNDAKHIADISVENFYGN